MVRKCRNYRKGGKKFQIFEKCLYIVKNSKYYKSFETFTHLSLELQQRILGDPAGGIHYRFFQVLTHALLFQFDAFFSNSMVY